MADAPNESRVGCARAVRCDGLFRCSVAFEPPQIRVWSARAGAGARTADANAAPRLGGHRSLRVSTGGNPQRLLFACGERVSSLLSERPFFVKQIRPAALLALLVPLVFSACSAGSPGGVVPKGVPNGSGTQEVGSFRPQIRSYRDALSAALSTMRPGQRVPNVFAQAQNRTLSVSEIATYIDPAVTGTDRLTAERIMSYMPANQRGDFVYMAPDGHLISNNPSLLQYVTATNGYTKRPSTAAYPTSNVTPMYYTSSCSPPQSNSGAFIREVSVCGMTDGWAFVSVPCGYTSFATGDEGQLYFELRGNAGSLSEGGLQYNSDSSIQPYMRTIGYSSNGYQQLLGGSQEYTCNDGTEIIHHGATSDGQYDFTEVGLLPSNIGADPQDQWINMNSQFFQAINANWLFLSAPSDISGSGTDAAGYPTPCTACSITKVTSIAQSGGYSEDGSYFGTDGTANYIQWMEVGFGELAASCSPAFNGGSLGTCQAEISNDPTVYYGGIQNYPNGFVASSNFYTLTYGPYESYDGIAVGTASAQSTTRRVAGGPFDEPLPPSPSPVPVPQHTPFPIPHPCGYAARTSSTGAKSLFACPPPIH